MLISGRDSPTSFIPHIPGPAGHGMIRYSAVGTMQGVWHARQERTSDRKSNIPLQNKYLLAAVHKTHRCLTVRRQPVIRGATEVHGPDQTKSDAGEAK